MDCIHPLVSWLPNLITWLVVFIGWYVVHNCTLLRERRREKREFAAITVDALHALETEAIEFHTAPVFNAAKAEDVRLKIDRLINKIQRPPIKELNISTQLLIRLRKAISSQNIDPSEFVSQNQDSQIVRDIRVAVDDISACIDSEKNNIWN